MIDEEQVQSWMRGLYTALETSDGTRSLCDCLSLAAQEQEGPKVRQNLNAVTEVVGMGYTLSSVMALHSWIFSPNHVAVVRYGEMYGELDLTLKRYVERPEDRASRCTPRT